VENWKPVTLGRNEKWCRHYGKNMAIPQNLKIQLLYDPAIPPQCNIDKRTENTLLKRYLYTHTRAGGVAQVVEHLPTY
jgi:hypothetical protein